MGRGCPCPVAGRSLRAPPCAHSVASALRHPGCACRRRRLPGHGQPLAWREGLANGGLEARRCSSGATLACSATSARLHGPWMAVQACSSTRLDGEPSHSSRTLAAAANAQACGVLGRAPAHPCGPASADARLAWMASHRIPAAPWLRLRMRKPAGAMDGNPVRHRICACSEQIPVKMGSVAPCRRSGYRARHGEREAS